MPPNTLILIKDPGHRCKIPQTFLSVLILGTSGQIYLGSMAHASEESRSTGGLYQINLRRKRPLKCDG